MVRAHWICIGLLGPLLLGTPVLAARARPVRARPAPSPQATAFEKDPDLRLVLDHRIARARTGGPRGQALRLTDDGDGVLQANPRGKIQVRTGSSTRLATPADLASFHITSAEKLDGLVKRVVARELVKLSGVTGSPSDADVVDKAREIVRKSTFELEHKALVDLLQTPDLRKLLPREVARDPEVREQGFSFEVQVPSTSGYRYGDLRSVHIHMDPTGRWTPSVYSSGGRVWPATLDELVRQGITGEQLADAIRVQSLSSLRGRHARQAEAARAALPFPMQLMKMFFPFARR